MVRRRKILAIIGAVLALGLASLLVAISHTSACKAPPVQTAPGAAMKAMVNRCYGPPTVATLEQLDRPQLAPDRVLVKVATASVNPVDLHFLSGEPYFIRLGSGLGAPKDVHMGIDFAGTVEAAGTQVTQFKPGDRVFGGAYGSFGEYVTVRAQGAIAPLADRTSFDQAAAMPVAGVTALQALRDQGKLRSGQTVLINGASGGVGTYAVQIAKLLGAHVTGVCSTRSMALVRTLGADNVIDYTREDFTRRPERYDLIVDNVGNHSFAEIRRALKPDGSVVSVGGGADCGFCFGLLAGLAREGIVSMFSRQKNHSFVAKLNAADLETLGRWMNDGKLRSVIDRRYALNEVPQALEYLAAGHAHGKVLVQVLAVDEATDRP